MTMGTSSEMPPSRMVSRSAFECVANQFLMSLPARLSVVYLGNDLARCIVAVRVYGGNGPDSARSGPGPRTHMVGHRYALAAFDQRPHFASAIDDGFQTLK